MLPMAVTSPQDMKGDRMKYIDIQNDVMSKYKIKLDPFSSCRGRTHAHVKQRRVCKLHQKNSISSTFDLLHEIGHCETTKGWMRRCEEEYHATMWAIEKCNEYGLDVPDSIIDKYQKYINMEHDRGIRRGGNLPDVKDFSLRK